MKMTPWSQRTFLPISDDGLLPVLIERLDGTEYRLIGKLAEEEDFDATKKVNGKWSIKEELGHLLVLENLWAGRLRDILAEKEEMRGAEKVYKKAEKADFNKQDLEELIDEFCEAREVLLGLLKNVKKEDLQKSSLHPRLKTSMRIIDLANFVAEHDDYHLVKISHLINI